MNPSPCFFCGGVTGSLTYVPPDLSYCPSCVELVQHFSRGCVAARVHNLAAENKWNDVISALVARRWCCRNSVIFGAQPKDK